MGVVRSDFCSANGCSISAMVEWRLSGVTRTVGQLSHRRIWSSASWQAGDEDNGNPDKSCRSRRRGRMQEVGLDKTSLRSDRLRRRVRATADRHGSEQANSPLDPELHRDGCPGRKCFASFRIDQQTEYHISQARHLCTGHRADDSRGSEFHSVFLDAGYGGAGNCHGAFGGTDSPCLRK